MKLNLRKRLGKRIQELRLKNGLKQSELAEKVGCSAVHIGYIERGLKCPTIFQFLKIAKVLNIKMDDFFTDFK